MGGSRPEPRAPRMPEPRTMRPMAEPREFKKGGKVRKTGFAKVHKGETIIPAQGAAAVLGGKKAYPKGRRVARKTRKKS